MGSETKSGNFKCIGRKLWSYPFKLPSDLLKIQAVFFRPDQPFTWASGIKSPVYCDNRLTLTDVEVRTDVGGGSGPPDSGALPGRWRS